MTEDREAYVAKQPSLLAISRVLEETARMLHDWALAEDPPLRRPTDKPMPVTASTVRTIIAARWLRREFLGFDAGDPEWSLMLELYAARLEGREIHQTGLSVAAGVPRARPCKRPAAGSRPACSPPGPTRGTAENYSSPSPCRPRNGSAPHRRPEDRFADRLSPPLNPPPVCRGRGTARSAVEGFFGLSKAPPPGFA